MVWEVATVVWKQCQAWVRLKWYYERRLDVSRKFSKPTDRSTLRSNWLVALHSSRRLVQSKVLRIIILEKRNKICRQQLFPCLADRKRSARQAKSGPKPAFSPENYLCNTFDKKIEDARIATASANQAMFVGAISWIVFLENGDSQWCHIGGQIVSVQAVCFWPTADMAAEAIRWIDTLAPYIINSFNMLLTTKQFPSPRRHASVTPYLKKAGMDKTAPSNYHPVSKLPFWSTALERIVNF